MTDDQTTVPVPVDETNRAKDETSNDNPVGNGSLNYPEQTEIEDDEVGREQNQDQVNNLPKTS